MNFMLTAPGEEPVELEGMFPADADRVYRAWTDPDDLKAWFGRDAGQLKAAEVDLRIGGAWRFHMGSSGDAETYLQGEYLEIEPGERLVFSWCYVVAGADGESESSPVSQVTITFEPVGKATRMRLKHEAIETTDGRSGVGAGWQAS